ncbi:MAG: GDP-L-fucose synthase [DPANN group archaeon]|nr:GDP-L-fucose synthase [DPANN group archaeon]
MMELTYLKNKKIIITGGNGFLGKNVVKKLMQFGIQKENIFVPGSKEYDLTEKYNIARMFKTFPADVVIHLAGRIGGIGANMERPATFFYDNLVMGVNLMELSYRNNVDKFISIGTTCSYPKNAQMPLKEEYLWAGYPAEETAPYGLAKKILITQSEAYRKQYNFNAIQLLPVNLYGPGDNFDLVTSHVIPALIRKCLDALANNAKTLTVWGTGSATRDFLYVEDAAEAIVLAADRYNSSQPVNIGSGKEIPIKQIIETICKITNYSGKIIWDSSKPDGTPRRCVDTSSAKEKFGFEAKTPLELGLERTIAWYKEN